MILHVVKYPPPKNNLEPAARGAWKVALKVSRRCTSCVVQRRLLKPANGGDRSRLFSPWMVNIMGIEPTRREGKDLAFDSTEVSHSTLLQFRPHTLTFDPSLDKI